MAIQEISSGHTHGLQVRVGQGPGQTRFLAYRKHGGPSLTRRKAESIERALSEKADAPRKRRGALISTNRSGVPGLRFEWRDYGGPMVYLYLIGSYTDPIGRCRAFAYSVDKHGFDEVLSKGLKIRRSNGCDVPSFKKAKDDIWVHYLDMAASSNQ